MFNFWVRWLVQARPAPRARSSQEREMSNSFVGNLDIVPGNKNVYPAVVVRSTSGPFEQFQVDIEH